MSNKSEKIDSGSSKHALDSTVTSANVVEHAQKGFGTGSSNYEKNRPTYTDEATNVILKELILDSVPECSDLKYKILELGAGTGKFTERLASKLSHGTSYLAVDPSRNFLDLLESKSLSVDTALGAAHSLSLPDSSVQNIICAQSFHWFCDDESLQEMHRVLVPNGKLILIWNAKKYEEGWMKDVKKQREELMKRLDCPTVHWFNSMEWRTAIDPSPLFSLLQHHSLPGAEIKGVLDQIMANISTVSLYNALPKAERSAHLDDLRRTIMAYPGVNVECLAMPLSSEIYVYKSQDMIQ